MTDAVTVLILVIIVVAVTAAVKAAQSQVEEGLWQYCSISVWYLLGGSGVTCPSGVVAGVGGFNSPAASVVELLPED